MEQKSFYFREFSQRAYYYFFARSGNQGNICSLFPINARMYRTTQKCQVHIFSPFLLTRRYGKVSRQKREYRNFYFVFSTVVIQAWGDQPFPQVSVRHFLTYYIHFPNKSKIYRYFFRLAPSGPGRGWGLPQPGKNFIKIFVITALQNSLTLL